MWYKAECIRECTFRGVRRRPGSLYEGPVKPPHHFRIIEARKDGTAESPRRNVCPFCGNELPAALALSAADSFEEPLTGPGAEGSDDPGKKENQLKAMNKEKLAAYAGTLGLELEPGLNKAEMIEAIQAREVELFAQGAAGENDEGVI